ncbi:hypothetical protein MBLNU230_g0663t1 [Neophaeotheca triangularis]
MADEEKEKQEKLAAAKKRFEQLKKEQQKKGKKSGGGGGGKKKKEEEEKAKKEVEDAEAEVSKAQEDGDGEEEAGKGEEAVKEEEEETSKGEQAVADGDADAEANDAVKQSMQRSESFRKETAGPSAEVQELYRKQSARIAELEKENKSLQSQHEASTKRASKAEEELESAREASSDSDALHQKANEADKLKEELESTKRQLSQAQQKAGAGNRRQSTASPSDLSEQLASKTSAIENLEVEVSKLRNQIEALQQTNAEKDAAAVDLEERTKAADVATESARHELEQLRLSMGPAAEEKDKSTDVADPEALQKRISLLESDVRTANTAADAASARASQLEDKITALTKLHREAATASQNKDVELGSLREKLRRRDAGSHVRGGDADEFELGGDETETGVLRKKIRELEAENYEIRSGQWRERRAELQPGMEGHDDGYEDVDLHASTGHRGSLPRQSSTFQDVLTSGINAFTGRQPGRHGPLSPRHERSMSEDLLDDDEGEFDEGAWRQAQEEEAKRRVERVKEIKRGLEQWRGYKVDLRGLRMGEMPGREVGGVFEV